LEAPKKATEARKPQRQEKSRITPPSVSNEPLGTNSPSKWRGKINSFGGDVDQDLLLRSSKDLGLWVVEGGDLAMRLDPNSVLFLMRTSKLEKMRGRGINTPPRNVSVAAAMAGLSGAS
jgi:hypothetical protein